MEAGRSVTKSGSLSYDGRSIVAAERAAWNGETWDFAAVPTRSVEWQAWSGADIPWLLERHRRMTEGKPFAERQVLAKNGPKPLVSFQARFAGRRMSAVGWEADDHLAASASEVLWSSVRPGRNS